MQDIKDFKISLLETFEDVEIIDHWIMKYCRNMYPDNSIILLTKSEIQSLIDTCHSVLDDHSSSYTLLPSDLLDRYPNKYFDQLDSVTKKLAHVIDSINFNSEVILYFRFE